MANIELEHFIPFHKSELIDYLAERMENFKDKDKFRKFCKMVEAIYHFKFHENLEEVKKAYIAIDPDSEKNVFEINKVSDDIKKEKIRKIKEMTIELLGTANYKEITKEELEKAFEGASPLGIDLRVDFSKYEDFSIFYRAKYSDEYEKQVLLKKKKVDFNVLGRVVFMFKLKEETADTNKKDDKEKTNLRKDKFYIKLFKNVPELDLETIFPDTKIRMKLIDKLKIFIPLGVGGVSAVSKVINYITSNDSGGLAQLLFQVSFWALIGGLFLFAYKSYAGYKNTLEKYLKNLTTSLYFQNLDNNSGVFKYLLDDAEEQECKEVILAYYFLLTEKNRNFNEEILDGRIEEFFREELGKNLDFEVDDAVEKLKELNMIKSYGKYMTVCTLDEALEILDEEWDGYFNYS